MNHFRTLSSHRLAEMASRMPSVAVGIADFRVMSPQVAQVIVTPSTTNCTSEELAAAVTRSTGSKLVPVVGSFRPIPGARTPSLIGFVTTNKEVILASDARYSKLRPLTASTMLDPQDSTLWDIRKDDSGQTFVVRALEEDMTVLLSSYQARDISAPSLRETAAVTGAGNFIAYVDLDHGEMKYGFVLATTDEGLTVLSTDGESPVTIPESSVVEIAILGERTKVTAADVNLKMDDFDSRSAASMAEFYKALFGYAPGYVAEIQKQIDSHATV